MYERKNIGSNIQPQYSNIIFNIISKFKQLGFFIEPCISDMYDLPKVIIVYFRTMHFDYV